MIDESGIYYYECDECIVRLSNPRMCDQGDTWYNVEDYIGNGKWKKRASYLTTDCTNINYRLIKIDDLDYMELLFSYVE